MISHPLRRCLAAAFRSFFAGASSAVVCVSLAAAAAAVPKKFDISADVAANSLKSFSSQSGIEVIIAAELGREVRTNAVRGELAPREALQRMIEGTGLEVVEAEKSGALAIKRAGDRPNGVRAASAKASRPGNSTGAGGTIEGRVFNPATGEYLEFVRVTAEGTRLETFTDATGHYRLTNVPEGTVTVRAFRTGAPQQTGTVTVRRGDVAQQDFSLVTGQGRGDEAVQLAQFVVSGSTEMDGAAIAINTQRFAPNSMNVVAADEFGPVANGNAGEVLKSVPGITLSLGSQGEMYQVSLNGVPPNNVPVTVGGFDLANPTGTGRGAGLHLLSINNASRIEVSYTPTPETTGSALAGTVNLVPRSAFERSTPIYTLSVAALMRDNELNLGKTPGPQHEPQGKVRPEVMFSAVVPVNKRFGYTVSASTSGVYTPQDFIQMTWRGAGAVTNGTTFPDTTPDRPYLTAVAVRDRTAQPERQAFATTLDFRLTPNDIVSIAYQYGFSGAIQSERTLTFSIDRVQPGGFTPTSTRSTPGGGALQLSTTAFDVAQHLHMPSITYRHNGPVWRFEAGAGFSRATRENTSTSEGFFNNSVARRSNVTIAFDDIFYLRPGSISVTDVAGAPVDPYSIDGYALATANSNTLNTYSLQRNAFAHARRELGWRVPTALKAGLDFRQVVRDIRQWNPSYTFVGSDARAGQVLDESISQRVAPFGFPAIDFVSNLELYELYQANPALFTTNATAAANSAVAASKHAEEIISAAFVRADVQLLEGRLKLVGGLRVEQTNAKGEGQLIDPVRNARVDRGLRAEKEYLRLFPSLNASFNLFDNLIARAGYYQSVGRPDLVQYAGSLTLPNTEEEPGPANRISVNNVGIKAWTAHTFKAGLEYYWEPIGLLSVSAFQREIENFFGNTVFRPSAEFLGLYGLNPEDYGAYDVATQYNLPGTARMTGVDVNYKQALTFLPVWARGVQVFGNMSLLRTQGPAAANFAGYIPKTINWGASLTRSKYSVRLRWSYVGRARRGLVAAGRSIEEGTYNWVSKRLLVDLNGEYRLTSRISLFGNLSNFGDAPVDLGIYGPSTPEHAQFRQRQLFGSIWTFGVKGTF